VKTNSRQREMRDGTLTVRLAEADSRWTLELVGELDLANARTLSKALDQAEASGQSVRLDLTELEFIDSTGIAMLVAIHRKLGNDRLSIQPSKTSAVQRVLSLTGLDAELPFTHSNGDTTTEL
jgi:anti-sigma B factor antagonist